MNPDEAHAAAIAAARAAVAETHRQLAETSSDGALTERPRGGVPARGADRDRWLAMARGRHAYQVAIRRLQGLPVLPGPLPDEARPARPATRRSRR